MSSATHPLAPCSPIHHGIAIVLSLAMGMVAASCDVPLDPAPPETSPTDEKEHHHHNSDGHRGKHGASETPKTDAPNEAQNETTNTPPATQGVAWYLTLHDSGARDPVTGQESIFGFGSDGVAAGGVLSKVPDDEGALQDLRGMLTLADGSMLVISAWKHNTQILRFGVPTADARRPFIGVFTRDSETNPLLVHPYCMAVGPDGSIFVSNQDSNTVTRYGAPGTPNEGKPLGRDGLPDAAAKTAGLVVPSREMEKHGVKEVRGIAFASDGTLLVADRGKGEVTRWNIATGERLGTLASKDDGIETPIQLLVAPNGNTLYISDNKRNEVFQLDLAQAKPGEQSGKNTSKITSKNASVFLGEDAGIDATSSLALHDGYLYVGSRKAREILRFRCQDGMADTKPFIANLPDNPEFFVPSMKQVP